MRTYLASLAAAPPPRPADLPLPGAAPGALASCADALFGLVARLVGLSGHTLASVAAIAHGSAASALRAFPPFQDRVVALAGAALRPEAWLQPPAPGALGPARRAQVLGGLGAALRLLADPRGARRSARRFASAARQIQNIFGGRLSVALAPPEARPALCDGLHAALAAHADQWQAPAPADADHVARLYDAMAGAGGLGGALRALSTGGGRPAPRRGPRTPSTGASSSSPRGRWGSCSRPARPSATRRPQWPRRRRRARSVARRPPS